MNRKAIRIMLAIVTGLVTVMMGIVSLTFSNMTSQDYDKVIQPYFPLPQAADQGLEMVKTLGAWFGFSLMVVLTLYFIALLIYKGRLFWSGILLAFAGLVLLLGSQLLMFPFAFFYFLGAAFCWIKKEDTHDS